MNFSTPEEAFEYLGTFMNFEKTRKQTIRDYRLSRMEALLAHFGNPHRSIKLIHIAGSKGKGSTGILVSSGLEALGFKTGLYTSPHVSTYRERITKGGRFFDDKVYIETVEEIAAGLPSFSVDNETGSSEPTTFELLTLTAFLIFKKTGCSWGVIETGIGGRLDATNVITPEAVIITPIEVEHTDILGDTLDKIAYEKAGIIKKGTPVFSAPQKEEARRILEKKADAEGATINFAEDIFPVVHSFQDESENRVQLVRRDAATVDLAINLPGQIQAMNAALAWLCLETLFGTESSGSGTEHFKKKLLGKFGKKGLPGRFEIIKMGITYIFDGAHTPESIGYTLETYKKIFGKGGILIFGSVEGKDYRGMAELLTPNFDAIIISTPGTFKESDPDKVYGTFKELRPDTVLEKDPQKALKKGVELIKSGKAEGTILTTGSFYMVSEIRSLVV